MRVLRINRGNAASALLKELEDEGSAKQAVALGTGSAGSLEELELAYYLAERAFVKKTNIAKKLRYEFLLWLAGKTNIGSAIEATAPEKGGAALVVVFPGRAGQALVRKLEALGAKEAKLKKNAEPLALERISLSRLK
jgi:tRNA threonylcarbamoyladenosine modification (KEOPS) complex Cgi121 subunit